MAIGREPGREDRAESAAADAESEEKGGGDLLQRAMQRRVIQRKASRTQAGPAEVPKGSGSALEGGTRSRMEGALGGDLSSVRVHTGGDSERAADDLGARAFTVGNDVHFGRGEFAPGSREGDRLMAHELHHVLHGDGRVARKEKPGEEADVSQPGDESEKAADQAGDKAANELHGDDKANEAKDKKGEPAAPVAKGKTGIIVGGTLQVKTKDKDASLEPGMVVEVIEDAGDKLKVKVYSGLDGAETEIPKASFQEQPGVAMDDDGKPRNDVYKEFQGELWGEGGPKPEDAVQGYIADCYLVAAMGSIAAANKDAIVKAFNPKEPNQKSYTVTLYKPKEDSEDLEPVSISVDTMLPAINEKPAEGEAAGAATPAYAGNDSKPKPLWPALMEKAYAIMSEGYAKAGEGGAAGDAMEAITGQKSSYEDAGNKDTVIERFKKYKEEGKAVVCGTLGSMETKKEKAFKKDGDKYSAKLTTHEGKSCEVMKDTLKIENTGEKGGSYADDGNGAVEGEGLEEGSVEYPTGKVDLDFEDDAEPKKADDLTAEYSFRGMLDDGLKIHAWHMYEFVDVVGDNLIFKNPWGFEDPKPIPADQFVKFFEGSTTLAIPKDDKPVK